MRVPVIELNFAVRPPGPNEFLSLDVGHFKSVTDTYGHQTCDNVLISVPRAIQRMIRNEDTLAR